MSGPTFFFSCHKFLSKKNVYGVLRFSNHMSYFYIKVMFEDSHCIFTLIALLKFRNIGLKWNVNYIKKAAS